MVAYALNPQYLRGRDRRISVSLKLEREIDRERERDRQKDRQTEKSTYVTAFTRPL